jgi:hypothetical protein
VNRTIFLAAALLASEAVSAAGIQSGTVADIRVSTQTLASGNPTHVRLQNGTTSSAMASCATSGFFAINTDTPAGKSMLAALLMAEAAMPPKQVIIWGTGQCDLRADMETAFQVSVVP